MFCVITVSRETVKLQSLAQADLFMERSHFLCMFTSHNQENAYDVDN